MAPSTSQTSAIVFTNAPLNYSALGEAFMEVEACLLHNVLLYIQAVKEEADLQRFEAQSFAVDTTHSMYRQSNSKKSLYCAVQKMRRLSLQPL